MENSSLSNQPNKLTMLSFRNIKLIILSDFDNHNLFSEIVIYFLKNKFMERKLIPYKKEIINYIKKNNLILKNNNKEENHHIYIYENLKNLEKYIIELLKLEKNDYKIKFFNINIKEIISEFDLINKVKNILFCKISNKTKNQLKQIELIEFINNFNNNEKTNYFDKKKDCEKVNIKNYSINREKYERKNSFEIIRENKKLEGNISHDYFTPLDINIEKELLNKRKINLNYRFINEDFRVENINNKIESNSKNISLPSIENQICNINDYEKINSKIISIAELKYNQSKIKILKSIELNKHLKTDIEIENTNCKSKTFYNQISLERNEDNQSALLFGRKKSTIFLRKNIFKDELNFNFKANENLNIKIRKSFNTLDSKSKIKENKNSLLKIKEKNIVLLDKIIIKIKNFLLEKIHLRIKNINLLEIFRNDKSIFQKYCISTDYVPFSDYNSEFLLYSFISDSIYRKLKERYSYINYKSFFQSSFENMFSKINFENYLVKEEFTIYLITLLSIIREIEFEGKEFDQYITKKSFNSLILIDSFLFKIIIFTNRIYEKNNLIIDLILTTFGINMRVDIKIFYEYKLLFDKFYFNPIFSKKLLFLKKMFNLINLSQKFYSENIKELYKILNINHNYFQLIKEINEGQFKILPQKKKEYIEYVFERFIRYVKL